jgi:streptomycin 6-kinase
VSRPPAIDRDALARLGVDDQLIAKRERLDGERALAFLAALPALSQRWQAELGLRHARVMPGGVLSAALLCERAADGAPVVLKLSSEHAASAATEAAALAAWEGVGACRLLYASEDARALLLQAITPGTALRPSGDDRADAERAAGLLRTLHRIAPERIPAAIPDATVELDWRFRRAHEKLDGPSYARGLLTHDELARAHRTALALHRRASVRLMLHGDFIAKNILLDGDGGWWAIDPRPCRGDPCSEAAFWALAHRPGEGVRERCELLAAALELDPARTSAWATAFAASEAALVTDADRARAHYTVLTDG